MRKTAVALLLATGSATALLAGTAANAQSAPAAAHTSAARAAWMAQYASQQMATRTQATTGDPSPSDFSAGYGVLGAAHASTSVEAHWTQPKVTCTKEGPGLRVRVAFNAWKMESDMGVGVFSACIPSGPNGPVAPDYWAYGDLNSEANGGSDIADGKVAPGDKFYAKVTSDGKGGYTEYFKDETQGWDHTTQGKSPTTTDTDADILLNDNAVPDLKLDAPITVSGALVNGKPIAQSNPTKSILVDQNNKPFIDASDIDKSGNFTISPAG